jgi:hypothetical protein
MPSEIPENPLRQFHASILGHPPAPLHKSIQHFLSKLEKRRVEDQPKDNHLQFALYLDHDPILEAGRVGSLIEPGGGAKLAGLEYNCEGQVGLGIRVSQQFEQDLVLVEPGILAEQDLSGGKVSHEHIVDEQLLLGHLGEGDAEGVGHELLDLDGPLEHPLIDVGGPQVVPLAGQALAPRGLD